MISLATRPAVDGPSQAARRRSPALGSAAICLGFLMITLDATIVNVALGPSAGQLGGSLALELVEYEHSGVEEADV